MTTEGFVASHARDAKFERGLRSFYEYRDLGIQAATKGRVDAHVIRAAAGMVRCGPIITAGRPTAQRGSHPGKGESMPRTGRRPAAPPRAGVGRRWMLCGLPQPGERFTTVIWSFKVQ